MRSYNLDTFIKDFKEGISKPEDYLNVDETLSSNLKRKLKDVYDFSKTEQIKKKKSNALPELIVTNFNLEQIWQQLELQNDDILKDYVNNLSKFVVRKDKLLFKDLEDTKILDQNGELSENDDEFHKEGIEEKSSEESSESDLETNDLNINSDDSDSDEDGQDTTEESTNKRKLKKSVVDDEFFKLDEMEQFLNLEDRKMNEPDSGKDSDSESDSKEGSLDLFEEESDEEEENDKMKTARFKDFFKKADEPPSKRKKRNKFLEELSDNEDPSVDTNNQKSSLEQRQERLKRRIEDIEGQAVGEKPWQLKGEITAGNRPQNSLLEEVLEFDLTTRPAPVITEQTTLQLEDIIKQRIKDQVFDSVERKARPVETPLEFKKKLVLDQEKSKLSLAQIYEKEFQDQQAALDPENAEKPEEEPEIHKEVKKMMRELFSKLDALSNFHFTPKPAMPELKIVTNLPAVNMEEVAPLAMSEAGLLAPEEIRNKPKGDVIGKGERTKTDKNRERRKKKQKQRAHLKAKEAKGKKKPRIEIGVPKKYGKGKGAKVKAVK